MKLRLRLLVVTALASTLFSPLSIANLSSPILRVLNLNVWLDDSEIAFDRLKQQINEVQSLEPDIVCLREVFDNRAGNLYVEKMQKLTIVLEHSHQVSTGWVGRMGEMVKSKGFISANYTMGDQKLTVVNAHLSGGAKNKKREEQVREMARALVGEDFKNPRNELPIILCSDINSDQPQAEAWGDNGHLKIQEGETGQRVNSIHLYPGERKAFKILDSFRVLDSSSYFSDHSGVLTVLELIDRF
jgi:endonuclease/exonuclease/phosphatase family metal-dependent hydrolase